MLRLGYYIGLFYKVSDEDNIVVANWWAILKWAMAKYYQRNNGHEQLAWMILFQQLDIWLSLRKDEKPCLDAKTIHQHPQWKHDKGYFFSLAVTTNNSRNIRVREWDSYWEKRRHV